MNIDVVVVTYNRLAKLKHTLDCYANQTVSFRTLIIVDNNSTDGTREFLKQWETTTESFNKHVIYLESNVGGSGGFYEGEKYALTLNGDWVLIADDDAYPHMDLFERFIEAENETSILRPSAICTEVQYSDGSINLNHRAKYYITDNNFIDSLAKIDNYKLAYFRIDFLSYVGAFINIEALKKVGLVNPDFFIYQDDHEHSIRLAKYGPIVCAPKMKITHDELKRLQENSPNETATWKEYYLLRNRLIMLYLHYPECATNYLWNFYKSLNSHHIYSLSVADKMHLEACKDAKKRKLGIHSIYRPGVDFSNIELPYPKYKWQIIYWYLRIKKSIKCLIKI